jgi:hypothetical protein
MKLRKNLAVITTVVMLSTVTVPALAASAESDSNSWFNWFFSLFQTNEAEKADEDEASFSGLGRPER